MIFELLFLAVLVASLIMLVRVLILVVRGKRHAAARTGTALAVGWAIYFLILVVSSATKPQRVFPMGTERCFDEMCFAVTSVQTASQLGPADQPVKARGQFYVLTMRMHSRSRGRAQSEGGLRALILDDGKTYPVSDEGQRAWETVNGRTAKLTTRLEAGETTTCVQVFDLPAQATASLGLILSHGFTPGYFVIGESPIFSKPSIMQITQ